ncbi:MAG: hypothetical protein EP298_00965 [Gammaproteobacteria bacterium]|nr:MAG: hypothetical protein EP298_00965 [Gammaproteobacteria bacterium]UTW41923.1 hypothetical protein KFE69_10475 [bacterium SCSIO 12844]
MTIKISQSEVNKACELLQQESKSITISHVRNVLGKGTHSQLVDPVLRYKSSESEAKAYAKDELEIALSENSDTSSPKLNKKKKNLKKHSLIDQLKLYTKEHTLVIPEEHLIKLAQLADKYFQTSKDKLNQKHRKELQQLKIQIDHLETRIYSANEQLDKNKAIIEHLNQQQLLISKKDIPKHDFKSTLKTTKAEKTKVTTNKIKGPSVEEQLQPIHSARVAAYDFSTGNIVLKANDFNGPLLKILRLNQKEVISANVFYEYKTRFYHLSNCTSETITFLNDYHFTFSSALTSQVNKIFNH